MLLRQSVASVANWMHPTLQPYTEQGMKRVFHLGLSMLCLLALVLTPVLCGHGLSSAKSGCRQGMMHPAPMHQQHTMPPCCAAHSSEQPAQIGVDAELPASDLPSALPEVRFLTALPTSGPVTVVRRASASGAFRPPLRI